MPSKTTLDRLFECRVLDIGLASVALLVGFSFFPPLLLPFLLPLPFVAEGFSEDDELFLFIWVWALWRNLGYLAISLSDAVFSIQVAAVLQA